MRSELVNFTHAMAAIEKHGLPPSFFAHYVWHGAERSENICNPTSRFAIVPGVFHRHHLVLAVAAAPAFASYFIKRAFHIQPTAPNPALNPDGAKRRRLALR